MDVDPVRVALWDIRAQWESGVRRLTVAQSWLDQQNSVPPPDDDAIRALRDHVAELKEINNAVRSLLDEIEQAASR